MEEFWLILKNKWSNLSNFESENSIGWKRVKRLGNLISLHLTYGIEENKNTKKRSFWPIWRTKTLFSKNAQISATNSFFQNEPKILSSNFGGYVLAQLKDRKTFTSTLGFVKDRGMRLHPYKSVAYFCAITGAELSACFESDTKFE